MHLTDPTYYLAASYIRRHSARALRSQIKDAAPTWRCTSRWLDWEETAEDDPARTAAYDAADLFASNAIVMVAGPPYSPGKACELGLAIAHSLPVYTVTVADEPDLASELYRRRDGRVRYPNGRPRRRALPRFMGPASSARDAPKTTPRG